MESRSDRTRLDLDALERRLAPRACWYDDPDAYREGVRDALATVRGQVEGRDRGARVVLAG